MPDDLSSTGKQDDIRINRNQDHEVSYWSKELEVSKEELIKAIDAVGPLVKDVRKKLGN